MELKAYAMLSRPVNIVVASIAVVLAAGMTHEMSFSIVYAIASVICITAAGNAINDYFDYEIDVINKPQRPLPSGKIEKKSAYVFSLVMFAGGSAISFLISPLCALIACSASIVLYYYAKILKNEGFIGNLTIAGLTGMAIIYGGLSVSGIEQIMYVALFAFMVNLGREIVKDIEDYEGDKAGGARTLAIRYGIRTASRLGKIPLIALIAVTAVPYVTGLYNIYYLALVSVVDAILAYCVVILMKTPTISTATTVKSILKAVIIFGMFALYIGMF